MKRLILIAFAACGDVGPYTCQIDRDCILNTRSDGVCTNDGFCAFPDDTCMPSGLRYHESAGPEANQCVDPSNAPRTR